MMRHTARAGCLTVLIAAAAAAIGCSGDSSTSPTTTTTGTTTAMVTETFSGSIGQNGVAVYPFTVTTASSPLLAGFTSIGPASVTALGLGLGSWDPTASSCTLNLTQNDTARSGSTAINGTANAANYCLRVYDAGNVGAGVTASYVAQVQHY